MKKIKVIQIIDSLNVGGAEMMAVNIANKLLANEGESYLCTTRLEGYLKLKLNDRVTYFFLRKKSSFDISAIISLNLYIKKHKIDIIHAHSSSYFIATFVKIINPKVKLIWHNHFGAIQSLKAYKKKILKLFSYKFDAVIVVNTVLKNWCEQNLKAKKIYYIPNFPVLDDIEGKTHLRGLNGKRIVCLAGLRPVKDHIMLLKAFNKIVKIGTDWSLHLVGNHYNDAYYDMILNFLEQHKLIDAVFLYHDVIDIKNILSQSEIAVLSSKSEGLPVAMLEYGLASLPVIVTDVGQCKEVLNNGNFGIVVEKSNEKEMHKAIMSLINNEYLRKDYALKYNKHILKHYSDDKIITRLLKIYKNT